jgi:hypothetical protein
LNKKQAKNILLIKKANYFFTEILCTNSAEKKENKFYTREIENLIFFATIISAIVHIPAR